jgi:hypothetical protein
MLDIFSFNPCPHFDPKREKNKDDVKLLKDHEPAVLIVSIVVSVSFADLL